MPLTMITAPSAHPVTADDCKDFARVDFTDEDDLLDTLIGAATELVQESTGRQLKVATYRLSLRSWPHDCLIRLPRSPLVEVASVKYRDSDGTLQTLVADTDYLVDGAAEPPTVEPIASWPTTGEYPNAVQIEFSAGYPDTGSPAVSTVPNRARVAVKALVSHWYDNREPVPDTPRLKEMPYHVSRLIRGLRVWGQA